jgi:hypothetical protein
VNPQAIIASLPWLRRLWRVTPPQLRVPLLLVAAAIGVWQFIQGRRGQATTGTGDVADPRSPAGTVAAER